MMPTLQPSTQPAAQTSSPWTQLTPPPRCPRYHQPNRLIGTPRNARSWWQASPPASQPPTPNTQAPPTCGFSLHLYHPSPGCSSPPSEVFPHSLVDMAHPAVLCVHCSWGAAHFTPQPDLLWLQTLQCFLVGSTVISTTLLHTTLIFVAQPCISPCTHTVAPSAQHLSTLCH